MERVDLDAVRPSERFDYWRDVVCKNYVSANATVPRGNEPFSASLATNRVGPILLSDLDAPMHYWQRGPRHIRRDDQDVYILSLLEKGLGELDQYGRRVVQGVGDMVLYDSSAPFDYNFAAHMKLVKIPRHVFDSRIAKPRDLVAVRFSDNSPLKPILAGLITTASSLDLSKQADSIVGARVANSIVDVLVSMCDLFLDGVPQSGGAPQLEKVLRYARANLENENLTPETLANAGGMSVRTLNRLFGTIGTSPMRWIWTERLRATHRALTEKHVNSVTEAAFKYGFSELSHFSRSFKKMFGVTPSHAFAQLRLETLPPTLVTTDHGPSPQSRAALDDAKSQ
jgi:AraC-like DNA-binding protein